MSTCTAPSCVQSPLLWKDTKLLSASVEHTVNRLHGPPKENKFSAL